MFKSNSGDNGKTRRGFAAMDPEMQKEIASRGGRAAHRSGRAHQFTPEEARAAGLKSTGRGKATGSKPA